VKTSYPILLAALLMTSCISDNPENEAPIYIGVLPGMEDSCKKIFKSDYFHDECPGIEVKTEVDDSFKECWACSPRILSRPIEIIHKYEYWIDIDKIKSNGYIKAPLIFEELEKKLIPCSISIL
jgi:hypothetical protein